MSHYENFTGYHAQLYRFVEGTTATPFSARARDRVLHALVISAIRLHYPEFASNDGAAAIDKLTDEQLNEVKALIMNRLNIIKPSAKADGFLLQKCTVKVSLLSLIGIVLMPNLIHQKILQTIRKNFMRLV